jgi:hypothetical protein
MDTAPDAPADSALDERRLKSTPVQQLASFSPNSAEAPEPEEPEDEKKATTEAERPAHVTESGAATPSIQTSREIGPDSAAAPVSPPASDRNATTPAQVKTSSAPKSPTALDPKPQSQPSSPNAQFLPQDDRRPQGAAPINAATMAVGALTGAFRRSETRSQLPAPAAPADPRPSAPQSLLNRFAVKHILDTLRGPQDQTHAAPPASTLAAEKAGATVSTNATRSPTTNAVASPGGLRDKLTTFTAERMQPRRDAEQLRGVTQAATGVIASLQALEQRETTGILKKIRDAAKTNGGIENVLSEMRPGGQFEDLRKDFNTVLSHDQGFAAAYDKATSAIADYAETRAALAPPSRLRGDPNLARLQTLDQEMAEAAKTLPGIKDGQSAFEDLVDSGKEAVQKLFSAVQQTFSRSADLRGPSPSPGFGR